VRLEMRRVAGLAVAVLALLLSAACCCKQPPFLIGDTISGGPDGYAFVKVAVTLGKNAAGTCRVLDVLPDTVYVFPGSAIRWKINNACDETPARRELRFTPPTPRFAGAAGKAGTAGTAAPTGEQSPVPEKWSFANCTAKIDLGPQKDARNVLLCEVPESVQPGLYKYGLEGDIEPYDPGVEVRPGGGGR
jgi:hypothetical protein